MAEKTGKRGDRSGRRALLVVDMLNGFLDPKGRLYCGDEARKIIPFVRRRIGRFRRDGQPVIFLCDSHDEDDPEFRKWPAHCVRGTWEAEIIPELPVEGATVLRKSTLSSFYRTQLHRRLRSIAPKVVELVGVCTNICVLLAAAELSARDYRVRVLSKGVATFDSKAHRFALEQIKSAFGAEVV